MQKEDITFLGNRKVQTNQFILLLFISHEKNGAYELTKKGMLFILHSSKLLFSISRFDHSAPCLYLVFINSGNLQENSNLTLL